MQGNISFEKIKRKEKLPYNVVIKTKSVKNWKREDKRSKWDE